MAYTYSWTEDIDTVSVLVTLEHNKSVKFKYIKSEDDKINAFSVMGEIRKFLPYKVCERLKPV